jgi:hypothetical protein
MKKLRRRYSKEEFASRGQKILMREVQPKLGPEDDGKFVAIDIETSAYEMDWDDYTAGERLLARLPNAQIWLARAGRRAAYTLRGRQVRWEKT